MSNIAEGFEKEGRGEFFQGLTIAKGSSGEVRSLLYVAFDTGCINDETFQRLKNQSEEVSRLVSSLRRSVAEQRQYDRESRM